MIEFWKGGVGGGGGGGGAGSQNSLYFQYERKKQNKTRVSSLEVYVSKRDLSNFYL